MKNLIQFLKNIWLFRKELWMFRSFDHAYCTNIFLRSLELLRDGIKKYHNHINYKEDIKNINRTIRMIKRYDSHFAFDYASRKSKIPKAFIILTWNDPLSKEYYSEVNRINRLIKKKVIKYLSDDSSGYETWWD